MRDRHGRERSGRRARRFSWVPLAIATGLLAANAGADGEAVGPGAQRAIEDPAARMQSTELANGLTVLTLEDHTTPVVSFQAWVEVGSVDETRFTGLAHLFEHMMFKGSRNLAEERHARLIEARGGRVNAFTSRDVTVYFEDVTADTLPLVIDLEAERFANLDISESTLTSEREVVIEERRMRTEDNPNGRAFEALAALAWRSNTYRRPVIGWREDLEQTTVAACREFFDTFYSANNLVLSIVGDFDTEETLAHVKKAFGGLRHADEIPRVPFRKPAQRGERREVVEFEVQSPILLASWHAPATGHADAEALDVASQILSAGRSSRLYRRLVHDEQIALYADGGYWELQQAGLFFASAAARPGSSISRVEELFLAEIERIRAEGVTADEVEKAKRQLEVTLVNGLATAHALASRIARETLSFGRVRSLQERLDAILAVGPEDVQRVMQTYLRPDQLTVVHVVPPAKPAPPAAAAERGSE
jgi:zinc protease